MAVRDAEGEVGAECADTMAGEPEDRGSVHSSPSPPRVIRVIAYRTINMYTEVKR